MAPGELLAVYVGLIDPLLKSMEDVLKIDYSKTIKSNIGDSFSRVPARRSEEEGSIRKVCENCLYTLDYITTRARYSNLKVLEFEMRGFYDIGMEEYIRFLNALSCVETKSKYDGKFFLDLATKIDIKRVAINKLFFLDRCMAVLTILNCYKYYDLAGILSQLILKQLNVYIGGV